MKLSKALLGAIVVGASIQVSASSCTKENKIKPQATSETQTQSESTTPPNPPPNCEPCPACGMG